ncbi:MAG: proton-conducting transporter membrane subunit [Desulfurococcaceae archaeon TW002]
MSAFLIFLEAKNDGILVYPLGGFPPPLGILYVVDLFSATMGLFITSFFLILYLLLFFVVEDVNEYFLALYLGLEAGLLGITYTGDLFNMFVMMEVTLISSYGLIAFSKKANAYLATFRYVMIGGAGGLLFFAGVTLIYFAAGSLNIGQLGAVFDGISIGYVGQSAYASTAILLYLVLLFWGLAIDEALAPFHFWLPGAYSSANPVVASLLAGIGEGVAFYALMRISFTIVGYVPGSIMLFLVVLGVLTILVGGVGMVYTRRLTEIVAYSVILDAGYIAIALSLGSPGVSVALTYIIAHILVKPILFLTAGWARESVGSDSLEELRGVLRVSRSLQVGFVVGAAAVIGIPPTILFVAKLQGYMIILEQVWRNVVYAGVLGVMLIGSVLALVSFIKAISVVILSPPARSFPKPPAILNAYVIALSIAVIMFGLLYATLIEDLVTNASNALIFGRSNYLGTVLSMTWR